MNDYGEISDYFKQNIEFQYLNSIKYKVLLQKHRYMKGIKGRADEDNFILLVNKDEKPGELSKVVFTQTGDIKPDMNSSRHNMMGALDSNISQQNDIEFAEQEEEENQQMLEILDKKLEGYSIKIHRMLVKIDQLHSDKEKFLDTLDYSIHELKKWRKKYR